MSAGQALEDGSRYGTLSLGDRPAILAAIKTKSRKALLLSLLLLLLLLLLL